MKELITLLFWAGIVAAVFFFIGYNKLQRISQLVKEAASNIQVMLRKKLELTQQAMDVCKGFADHEKLVQLKVSSDMANSFKDLANANARAEQALAYVSQLASRFPELKADAHFMNLSNQLESLGNQLQYKREQYNAHVRNYNTVRTTIPTVFVARALKFLIFLITGCEKGDVKHQQSPILQQPAKAGISDGAAQQIALGFMETNKILYEADIVGVRDSSYGGKPVKAVVIQLTDKKWIQPAMFVLNIDEKGKILQIAPVH
jgi:hypothetical protein